MARQTKLNRDIIFDDRFERREPVMDADFETIKPPEKTRIAQTVKAPQKFERQQNGPSQNGPSADKIGMTVFDKKPTRLLNDDSISFYGFGALLVLFSFWVSGGHNLFRQVDTITTASIDAAKATTEIAEAAWRVVNIDGKNALHVEGIVRNSGPVAVHTKPVTVTVTQADGATKRYLLGQKGWTLGPGQEVVVSGRLDIASDGIASVVISAND